MAAAAGGEGLNAEDLFNSSKWRGLGSGGRHIPTGMNMGTANAGPSFNFHDGYVRRNSTMTGQGDTKTFTLSCWIYGHYSGANQYIINYTNSAISIRLDAGQLKMTGYLPGYGLAFNAQSNSTVYTAGEWAHLAISIDTNNSSNRHVYINDSAVSMNWTGYSSSGSIITGSGNFMLTEYGGENEDWRIAHLFYDHTYRDLSVTSNRRLFYTSTGGIAANQASLNPLVYLKLDTEGSAGTNSGTGGNLDVVGDLRYDPDFGPYTGDEGQGGMIWFTKSNTTERNYIVDSERGAGKTMRTTEQDIERTTGHHVSFDHKGYTMGQDMNITDDYVAWSFRKAPKFFDIQTWTGTGSARTISHDLGSTPGMIIVGRRDSASDWAVYHRGLNSGTNPQNKHLELNSSSGQGDNTGYWNDTAPTSTEFTVGVNSRVNANGGTYVAYIFAHNDGDGNFGPTGDQDIIKCGYYTSGGTDHSPFVDLGFEPEWLMVKSFTNSDNWVIMENKRGWVVNHGGNESDTPVIYGNTTSVAQNYRQAYIDIDGFYAGQGPDTNETGQSYVYMAIRHTSQGFPTRANKVWDYKLQNPNSSLSGFQVKHRTIRDPDMTIASERDRSPANQNVVFNKLNGYQWANYTNYNWQMVGGSGTYYQDDRRDSESFQDKWFYPQLSANSSIIYHHWKRASGFFDMVDYTGDGVSGLTVKHNLNQAPEMMWVKRRNSIGNWEVYYNTGNSGVNNGLGLLRLNVSAADLNGTFMWGNTHPTDSVFTLGSVSGVNASAGEYIAYLFGSVEGVSKIGLYTGNGSSQTINCGFTNGARYVLIKRTDSTGQWTYYDALRGISTGDDPLLTMNLTNAELTTQDDVDPHSSGFIVNDDGNNTNTSGGTYLFYAIA